MKTPPYNERVMLPANLVPMRAFVSSNNERVMDVHPHWHDEIELLYYIRGQARQQVGAQHFLAEAGHLVVIGGGVVHGTQAEGIANCDIRVIQANLHELYQHCPIPGMKDLLDSYQGQTFVGRQELMPDCWNMLVALFGEVYDHLEHHGNDASALFRAYMSLGNLLSRLQDMGCDKHHVPQPAAVLPVRYDVLEKTFHLIDTSFAGEITTEQAARVANLSVSHFCRLFKAYTGVSFGNYLNRYRIRQAEKMLRVAGNLSDIAFSCGFGSISAFVRCFVRIHQVTPSAWRKALWSK